MGPRNRVLHGAADCRKRSAIFGGKDVSGHAQQRSVVSCAKMAEPTAKPFGLCSWVGPRNHVLDIEAERVLRVTSSKNGNISKMVHGRNVVTTDHYGIGAVLMTFSDFQGHSPIASFSSVSYSYAVVDKISNA